MPRVASKEKLERVAAEYLTNGNSWLQAMLSAGYAKSYSVRFSAKISDNAIVKAAVTAMSLQLSRKTGFTLQKIQEGHIELFELAKMKGDLATATQNWISIGKTIGCYTDTVNSGPGLTLNISGVTDNSPKSIDSKEFMLSDGKVVSDTWLGGKGENRLDRLPQDERTDGGGCTAAIGIEPDKQGISQEPGIAGDTADSSQPVIADDTIDSAVTDSPGPSPDSQAASPDITQPADIAPPADAPATDSDAQAEGTINEK